MTMPLTVMKRDAALTAIERSNPDVEYALGLAEAWMLGRGPSAEIALTALQLGMLERAAKLAIAVHGTTFTQFVRAAGEMYLRAQEGNDADHTRGKIP